MEPTALTLHFPERSKDDWWREHCVYPKLWIHFADPSSDICPKKIFSVKGVQDMCRSVFHSIIRLGSFTTSQGLYAWTDIRRALVDQTQLNYRQEQGMACILYPFQGSLQSSSSHSILTTTLQGRMRLRMSGRPSYPWSFMPKKGLWTWILVQLVNHYTILSST